MRTRNSMTTRGPDGAELWLPDDRKLGLAHRRLAIIDSTEADAQAMHSVDRRFTVTFHGEIYNYLTPDVACRARKRRRDYPIAFRHRGTAASLPPRRRGDGRKAARHVRVCTVGHSHPQLVSRPRPSQHQATVLRQRRVSFTLHCASQVAALKAGGNVNLTPDLGGTVGFLLLGSVPESFTLYKDIYLLAAGSTLQVAQTGAKRTKRYWHLSSVMHRAAFQSGAVPRGEEWDYLSAQLLGSVQAHLLADAPVGALLSAGLDSSTLVD